MRYEQLYAAGAISGGTTSQKRNPLCHVALFDFDPAEINLSLRTPVRKPMLGCHREQLAYPLIQRHVVSEKRKQSRADR